MTDRIDAIRARLSEVTLDACASRGNNYACCPYCGHGALQHAGPDSKSSLGVCWGHKNRGLESCDCPGWHPTMQVTYPRHFAAYAYDDLRYLLREVTRLRAVEARDA